jgi:hypothetical protein
VHRYCLSARGGRLAITLVWTDFPASVLGERSGASAATSCLGWRPAAAGLECQLKPSIHNLVLACLLRSRPAHTLPRHPSRCLLSQYPFLLALPTSAASQALVNDLDLTVKAAGLGSATLLGNGGLASDGATPDRCCV